MEDLSDNRHTVWTATKRWSCQIMAGGPSRRTVELVERINDGIRMRQLKRRGTKCPTENSSKEQ